MIVLNKEHIAQIITMPEVIDISRDSFKALSQGNVDMPAREAIYMGNKLSNKFAGLICFMPAYLPEMQYVGIKVGSVMPANPSKNLPLIHAQVLMLDASTGQMTAMLDGREITALRTGAASAVATDLLARKNSTTLAIIGAGVQAKYQAKAVTCVRNISHIYIYSRTKDKANLLAEELRLAIPNLTSVVVVDSIPEATLSADIICTATSSQTPILLSKDIKSGTHINVIGGHTKDGREVCAELLDNNYVCVEQYKASRDESCETQMVELGEVIMGCKPARLNAEQITIYSSVGVAIQDIAVAGKIVDKAKKHAIYANVIEVT